MESKRSNLMSCVRRVVSGRLVIALWNATDERNLGLIAAGVAFYSMFAIFPGMAAIISIWSVFADPMVVQGYMDAIHGVIPDTAYRLIGEQLSALIHAQAGEWTWATLLPLSLAIYSVHSAVSALIAGINAVQVRRHREGWMRLVGSLAMTIALLLLVLAALALVVAIPVTLNLLDPGPAKATVLRFAPWAVLFLVVKAALGLFYRWGASSDGPRHRWVSTGSLVAALLWAAVSFAFSLYLENIANYNRVYGSIGAVIALMMWLYLSAYIVLLGAVLNTELRRARSEQSIVPVVE